MKSEASIPEEDEPPMLRPGDFQWILDSVYLAGSQGADPRGIPDLPGLGTPVDPLNYQQRQLVAAWCLREIASAAIECLDRLPVDLQSVVAGHASSWPVLLRPKLASSAKRTAARVAGLGLARELPINLENSTASASSGKVSIHESTRPGTGLAAHLYEILNELRELEHPESRMSSYDPLVVCALAPEMLADAFEGSLRDDVGIDGADQQEGREPDSSRITGAVEADRRRRARIAFGRELHLQFLVATLPALTRETVDHWALAGLRHLQCTNGGFLAHDVASDKGGAVTMERLSSMIPEDYWTAKKLTAAKEGIDAVTFLEKNVRIDLRRGFAALAKPFGK